MSHKKSLPDPVAAVRRCWANERALTTSKIACARTLHVHINRQLGRKNAFPLLDGLCEVLEAALFHGKQLDAEAVHEQLAFISSAARLIGYHRKTWVRPRWRHAAFEQAMEAVCILGRRSSAKGLIGFTIELSGGGSVIVDKTFLASYIVDPPKENDVFEDASSTTDSVNQAEVA